MKFIDQINEHNITKQRIEFVLDSQKQSYSDALNQAISNKQVYINNLPTFESEIFSLEKIIKINRRAGNSFAVLRDEIQIKSFQIVSNQHKMIASILVSLDNEQSQTYNKELKKFINQNIFNNQKLIEVDYQYILDLNTNSKTIKQAKVKVLEYHKLIEINEDIKSYLYLYENKMYRLNKYSKYHMINPVIYVNNLIIVKKINPILNGYGLSVTKIILILFLILIIYFIRKLVLLTLDRYLLRVGFLKKYSKDIVVLVKKPIDKLIIIINLNMVIYVYNDFISIDIILRFFNMLYAVLFTYIIYKILNAVAVIKINEIDKTNTKIKNEIINVSIKLANFVILMLGVLLVLFLAGVNLTAVLSGLGIGGFAVALAAKDSLANFFGTLSILLSDVFSQGDWIAIDGQEGVVVEIGLRVTTLRTFDNALIAIPNAILANKDVKNWNKRSLGRRIKMSLGVQYNSKAVDIKKAIEEIRHMLEKHPQIASEHTEYDYSKKRSIKLISKDDKIGVKKTLLVYLDGFSDSSINILVYCFSKSVVWDEWLETKEDVMYKIMQIFEDNSLEFAFPSLSIYNENTSDA